jgi:hypothetical protein
MEQKNLCAEIQHKKSRFFGIGESIALIASTHQKNKNNLLKILLSAWQASWSYCTPDINDLLAVANADLMQSDDKTRIIEKLIETCIKQKNISCLADFSLQNPEYQQLVEQALKKADAFLKLDVLGYASKEQYQHDSSPGPPH